MKNQLINCKNCEEQFEEGFQFCPHCGQKAKDELTIGILFYNTISNYFSFDARFFKSFFPLLFRPGYLASRFIEGKRLLYLHPAQLYLFTSVVFFFLFSSYSRDSIQKFDKVLEEGFNNEAILEFDSIQKKGIDSVEFNKVKKSLKQNNVIAGLNDVDLVQLDSVFKSTKPNKNTTALFNYDKAKVDSLIAINAPEAEKLKAMGMTDDMGYFRKRIYKQTLKLYEQSGKGILQAFYDSIPISLFVLLPIFALILKLLFFRRGNFTHHLVFSFYYFSFLFTAMSIILLIELIFNIPDWIIWAVAFSTFFYLFLSIKYFYRQGYFVSFIKTVFTTFIYLIFVIPIAFIFVGIGSILTY